MKQVAIAVGWFGLSMLALISAEAVVGTDHIQAQVIPDGTLPTTVTTPNNLDFTINGGTRSGNNLFHSFSQFGVPTGGSALFNNAIDIQNIFSRVTGGSLSNIDGLLQTTGSANLFLLNPSGILFGANASLNIGGSFVGTTAQSIKFADGMEFSATNLNDRPLLTMSAPIGLQFGSNPGSITHQAATGFQVAPGKTLALVGGALTISGGTLAAPAGDIELGSVAAHSQVSMSPTTLAMSYAGATGFQDIQLTQGAQVDASGTGGGAIHVQARQFSLKQGARLRSNTLGSEPGNPIIIRASERVDIAGTEDLSPYNVYYGDEDLDASGLSGIYAVTKVGSTGDGGSIRVDSPYLSMSQAGAIVAQTYGQGNAGNLTIQSHTVEFMGNPDGNGFPTILSAETYGAGRSGDITINADRLISKDFVLVQTISNTAGDAGNLTVNVRQLQALNGTQFSSSTWDAGNGGNVMINATELIELIGFSTWEEGPFSTGLFSNVASSSTGNGGNVTITTGQLRVLQGAGIATSSRGKGNAGNINIWAKDTDIAGTSDDGELQSSIVASSKTNFRAGSINLLSDLLSVRNGANITVSNTGTGDAGNLNINAGRVLLDQDASLQAKVNGGNQGNIQLQARDLLLLRQGSQIVASATGISTGGNIIINAPVIVGLENSDIVANAVEGRGGNIQITTQGIIGLKYRDRTTPENDITASSEFGVNGTVDVNNVGVDPNSGLVKLSTTLIDSNQQVAAACSGTQSSSFVITGRGGVPKNPSQEFSHDRSWNDMRDLSAFHKSAIAQTPTPIPTIVQATTWQRNPQTGKVELLATQPAHPIPSATCARTSHPTGNDL
jgi:filamentous hemagglutinin family protein